MLGEKFTPGDDASHFCKPTAVAVASSGIVFVADGSVIDHGKFDIECYVQVL